MAEVRPRQPGGLTIRAAKGFRAAAGAVAEDGAGVTRPRRQPGQMPERAQLKGRGLPAEAGLVGLALGARPGGPSLALEASGAGAVFYQGTRKTGRARSAG
jgi:hypothetical protein